MPSAPLPVTITARDENPGVTRLALDLGAANLRLAEIALETDEPLFTRRVTVAVPDLVEDEIREREIAAGVVHRVTVGEAQAEHLRVEIEQPVRTRELLVFIHNQDNPPLPITAIRAQRRLSRLVFLAREPGDFRLLTGHRNCPAPRYDLTALADRLRTATAAEIVPGPLQENPGYREPETLPGLAESGAPLDVADWQFHKTIQVARPGAQQVELDPEVLARAEPSLADLRLMRGDRQIPFILERPSVTRELTPVHHTGSRCQAPAALALVARADPAWSPDFPRGLQHDHAAFRARPASLGKGRDRARR